MIIARPGNRIKSQPATTRKRKSSLIMVGILRAHKTLIATSKNTVISPLDSHLISKKYTHPAVTCYSKSAPSSRTVRVRSSMTSQSASSPKSMIWHWSSLFSSMTWFRRLWPRISVIVTVWNTFSSKSVSIFGLCSFLPFFQIPTVVAYSWLICRLECQHVNDGQAYRTPP